MSGFAPLVLELDPPPDPLDSCSRCRDLPFLIFLDSAAPSGPLGRYSFLSGDPAVVVRSKGERTERRTGAAGTWEQVAEDPLEYVRSTVLRSHATSAIADLPPFQGGVAGYIGYDWGTHLERVAPPRFDDLAIPDCMLGLYDWVIAWDHEQGRAWLISTGLPETGPDRSRRAVDRQASVRALLAGEGRAQSLPSHAPAHRPATTATLPLYPLADGIRSTFTRSGYCAAVRRVIDYLFAGDIFQANLSHRLQSRRAEPPFDLYRRLRRHNPAPFAAYLDFGELVVASSSPERFLRVSPETRVVEARPIKGTRPRGRDPEQDAALQLELRESEKDRAEHVMIVDVLRNDLSRVCRPGSVRVPELFALEQYATVHHLVSTVVGELAPDRDVVDLLRAAFPGGSITGAPKIRAMQIIAELEPTARGVYCGSIGYLSVTGALDTSIVIRAYLVLGEDVYFQVGGGIVADSDPEQEYRETLDKARGLIDALGAT
ncbi:MAG TPA: aminodeoxychorismate synthase component I [Gemmatimonadales bacterium]|nr:aminodeoxychorismate synthase component I [Gemmatimonadales bacterium]